MDDREEQDRRGQQLVERLGRLPPQQMRVHLSERPLAVLGHVERVLLVRRGQVRWLCPQVRGLRYVRLQLVVQVGGRVLRPVKPQPHPTPSRSWVEMPTRGSTTSDPRLKYDLEASALVIYRGDKAFVTFNDEAVPEQLLTHADVRALSEDDARSFEESLPVPLPPPERRARRTGLGDLISWIAQRVGLRECAGCRRRRTRLNKIPVWGWWARE